jgi:hypothetical protein
MTRILNRVLSVGGARYLALHWHLPTTGGAQRCMVRVAVSGWPLFLPLGGHPFQRSHLCLRPRRAKSIEERRMSGLIRRLPILLCALLMGAPQCMASDDNWTVVTLARDGSWGVACRSTQAQAIAEAIRSCRAMAGPSSDCGAQFAATRGGWTVVNLCGDHKVIATGSSLVDAEKQALIREVDLQLFYVPDLPSCRRVVTVDPSGTIVANNRQFSAAP